MPPFAIARDIASAVVDQLDHPYHNRVHVLDILDVLDTLGTACSSHEFALVETAAWFHDVGYVLGPRGHEERSATFARATLAFLGVRGVDARRVATLIRATHPRTPPESNLAALLCDANRWWLGAEYEAFQRYALAIRDEVDPSASDTQWLANATCPCVRQHEFHTDVARERFAAQQQANERQLRAELADAV
jgi:predicted metal-dependent HD superfamily phosphohydrolase